MLASDLGPCVEDIVEIIHGVDRDEHAARWERFMRVRQREKHFQMMANRELRGPQCVYE